MISKFSDVAVGLSDDRLGFLDYADGVIAPMENISKEDTPVTIGIFGSWGSGKTSFMQIMQELLKSRGYQTIFFKSWEYGNEEKPWIPFMIKVVDELFKEEIDKKKLIQNIFLFSTDMVLQTYSQGKISTGGILDLIKRIKKTSPVKEWSSKDAKIVIERVTKIGEFKKSIKERAEKSPKGKIIIFIDDLDRIPEKIVDFLNSLKTFLDIRGCIFVLGCDYKILDSALKQKYKEEKGGIYDDYFDKIVQTEFYIPKISEQAIKNYLQFLTGWSEGDIKECTQLVIHSIGGNPRKIKRVVNATMLIKSVFERRLFTFLQAFERPKTEIRIKRGGEGKEEEFEEPMALRSEITKIFTPTEVFDLLFDKKVLFKLVCMREQWSGLYEWILSEEKKQSALISLQDADTTTDIQKYLSELLITTTKGIGYKLEEKVSKEENLSIFLNDSPRFQGVEDLKTYLTLLEISSPEAGIFLKYEEPEKLPINLFNRYMLFERINKGEVNKEIIRRKINQMDWESDLSSYHFFIEVISAFGSDKLLKGLFEAEENLMQFAKKIRACTDLSAIGLLLGRVRRVGEGTARGLLNETKDTYVEKIRACTDLWAIGRLLHSVRGIDEGTARELLNETKDTYVEKIRACTDLWAIGWLLHRVRKVGEETARGLLNKTKDTIAKKISTRTDPEAIGRLLHRVRGIDEGTARELLNETKDTIAEKIRASTDPWGISELLRSVREIDEGAVRELLNKTKDTYAEKIRACIDPGGIGRLLHRVRGIDEGTARELLNETKDTYAEKIRARKAAEVIGWLSYSVDRIYEGAARYLNEIKDVNDREVEVYISPELFAIESLLAGVQNIDEEAARELLNETRDIIAKKIRASTDPWGISELLDRVREIDEGAARGLLSETKDTYAEKIRASTDLSAIELLLDGVREIDERAARELLNETKDTIAEKIRASTDLGDIPSLLSIVRGIDEETAEWLEEIEFKSKESLI